MTKSQYQRACAWDVYGVYINRHDNDHLPGFPSKKEVNRGVRKRGVLTGRFRSDPWGQWGLVYQMGRFR